MDTSQMKPAVAFRHIYVTARVESYHRWIHAPDDVSFLRNIHRHMFHVKVTLRVEHNNRALEFFQVQRRLTHCLAATIEGRVTEYSCEDIAQIVASHLEHDLGPSVVVSVEVSEDGENGAVVYFT